jgi:CRISPR-associated protein Cas1
MTEETLWPARNVAEYAYCPRLFYFMQVEGIFIPSADTEEGRFVHRRVDKPSAAPDADAAEGDSDVPERPRSIRSLALTSEAYGLTATLDIAEIAGRNAVPVEYRKGRPKRTWIASPPDDPGEGEEKPLSRPEPWPTDRVQVGLQAVLLREASYMVDHAILYYAAERLRLPVTLDGTLETEALATLEAAKACAQGPRPTPLLNDSRCVGCSLQPICLPDEVNLSRAVEDAKPRKLWPPRAEGIHVVAQRKGGRVSISGATARVIDSSGVVVKEMPLAGMESLSLLGNVQVSTQAIHAFSDRGIPIAFLSGAGRLVAMIDPLDSVSDLVRRSQVKRLEDPEVALELTRALVAAKISNQRTLLLRNHEALPERVSQQLEQEAASALASSAIDQVRGHEGQAAALYFEHFAGMFKGEVSREFDANGRQRRPPPDPINSCLSMAYSMLTHECVAALRTARLEPSIGALHVSRPGRPSLALDLMEPFRPLIADSVAVGAFNRGELGAGHFHRSAAGCMFTDAGRRAFFGAYGRRMDTEITHPVFEYRLTYRRMLALHARMIAAWIVGDVPTLSFLTTR